MDKIFSRIKIIVPSKGRLRKALADLFKERELHVIEETRSYVDDSSEDFYTTFLHPSDISQVLQMGNFHLGITGLDFIVENFLKKVGNVHRLKITQDGCFEIPILHNHINLLLLLPLSVGKSYLELIVPECWQDVRNVNDFREIAMDFKEIYGRAIRIATKFPYLTIAFLKEHQCLDYTLVHSAGATEATPQIGMADVIVDLVSTGKTLQSNYLKRIDGGRLLKSEAILIASTSIQWTEEALKTVIKLIDTLKKDKRVGKLLISKNSIKDFLIK